MADKVCHRIEEEDMFNVAESHGDVNHRRGSSPGEERSFATGEGRKRNTSGPLSAVAPVPAAKLL